jgi:SAM-dependent methyltransferase
MRLISPRADASALVAPGAAPFEADARGYDAVYDLPGARGHALRARLAAALRLLGNGPGEALDVGMGSGRLCAELAERGWTVSGVDASPRMVELARRRLLDRSESLLEARAEALPFPSASFDAVVTTGAIEFVDNVEVALLELVRVVRPGGRAVISFPHYGLPYSLFRRSLYYPAVRAIKHVAPFGRPAPARHRHPLARRRFERLLAHAGLEIESAEYVGVQIVPGRLAERLEGRGPAVGRLLACQIVFVARKPAA